MVLSLMLNNIIYSPTTLTCNTSRFKLALILFWREKMILSVKSFIKGFCSLPAGDGLLNFFYSQITQNLFLQFFMFLFKFNTILMRLVSSWNTWFREMNVLCQVDPPRLWSTFSSKKVPKYSAVFIEFWGLVIYVSFQEEILIT